MPKIDFKLAVSHERLCADALAEARALALAELVRLLDKAATGLTGLAPVSEQLGWAAKEEAARSMTAGEAEPSQIAMLEAEAEITGETVEGLCTLILRNAEQFNAGLARLAGLRRVAVAAISAADTPSAVSEALEEAKAVLAGE